MIPDLPEASLGKVVLDAFCIWLFANPLLKINTSSKTTVGFISGFSFPNVPSDLSLLAFGIPPAREAESAGGMPKVPKGQGLGRLACSDYSIIVL